MISFFLLPKGVLHKLDYYRSRFFWQGDSEKKKYRLVKWSVVCRPKDHGGLGVHDLEVKNSSLLGKWLFKRLTENGVWHTLLKRKFMGTKALSQVLWKPGDSHFWAGMMATKKFLFHYGTFSIKDGSQIRFWEDSWLGNSPLSEQFSALYSIVHRKSDTIALVMATSPLDVTFRRDLYGPRLVAWNALLQRLDSIHLSTGPDEFRRNLHPNGKFLVDSLYKAIIQSDIPVNCNKKIWKMKIPLKTNFFLYWYLHRGVILTKDNLVKRNWRGSTQCVFCHQDKTIKHLLFRYRFARSIWSLIQVALNLYPPTSVANIFGNWLHGIDLRFQTLIRVGALAVIWSLWLCRNDKVLNDKNCSLLQVVYRCTGFLHLWSRLQRMENRDLFTED
jgi:hypothetical protein